jgi:hypothetical protein
VLPDQNCDAHKQNRADTKEDANILARKSAAVISTPAMLGETVTREHNEEDRQSHDPLKRSQTEQSCDWKICVHASFAERQR